MSFYNLKRTKWVGVRGKLIKAFTRKQRKRFKFLNLARVKRETKVWGKVALKYQQQNSFAKKVSMSHVNSIPKDFYVNKSIKYTLCLMQNVVKVLLKTEILFWVCGFFASPQAARVHLLSGKIYLNHAKIFHSVFLKQNDVLQYIKPHFTLQKSFQLSHSFLNFSIIEVKKLTCKKYVLKRKKRKAENRKRRIISQSNSGCPGD